MPDVFDPPGALLVTTPIIQTANARLAQKALKNNKYDDFLQGDVDGTWGPECGRATLRAKEALGYPKAAIKPAFGKTLYGYLTGIKLTDAMVERRRLFLLGERRDLRLRALRFAKQEVGTKEHGDNLNKYGDWFGVNGVPWCAIFCSWCYFKAGATTTFQPGSRHSFCPTVMSWAQERENGLDQIRNPEPGHLVLYQFDEDANADHIGIFLEWIRKGSTFRTIEGNTSSASNANGGEVQRRERSMNQVYRPRGGGLGFVQVLH